jgi:hypothetical protein
MWKNMILYWSWNGENNDKRNNPVPTTKRIEYAKIIHSYYYLNGDDKGNHVISNLAVGVFDDNKYTKLNRGYSACEVEWFKKHGARVIMPSFIKHNLLHGYYHLIAIKKLVAKFFS